MTAKNGLSHRDPIREPGRSFHQQAEGALAPMEVTLVTGSTGLVGVEREA